MLAAKFRHIPCVIHESDMTPGLANKICIPCAHRVCTNFPETMKHIPAEKAVLTGSPIRQELFKGSREKGLAFCGFDDTKPVLLIMGGSLGAVAVNDAVRGILPELLQKFHVIHLCGKGKLDDSLNDTKGYPCPACSFVDDIPELISYKSLNLYLVSLLIFYLL